MVVHSTKRQALQQTEKKKQVTRDGRVLTAADYYVESLPGLAESDAVKLSMHAGLIPLRHGDSGHLFFWMFDALKPIPPPHHRKLIFWFNGGPGCSSMTGLFLEHGPLKVERTLDHVTLSLNPYSWNRHATMVFLDQPIGTGYAMESGNATVQSLNMGKIVDGFWIFLEGSWGYGRNCELMR
ncbi:serine carboxypeptidase-domain-containing protein [Chytridium lagenaria]|nr:serine carboxypeptidase-domain-containing protein [Chytridium lagenaria]